MSDRLTAKQEAFVQAYLRTGNSYQAYLEAYDCKADSARSTIDGNASRLLKNSKIKARLNEIQSQVTEKTAQKAIARSDEAKYTTEWVAKALESELNKASLKGNHNAAVAAIMGIAKVQGLIVNKSEDVTPRRNSKELLDRLRQLTPDGAAGGDSDPSGRAKESGRSRKTVPTVPGHGTA